MDSLEAMTNRQLAVAIVDSRRAASEWPDQSEHYLEQAEVYRAELARRLANSREGVN